MFSGWYVQSLDHQGISIRSLDKLPFTIDWEGGAEESFIHNSLGQLWDHADQLVSEEGDSSLLEGLSIGLDDDLLGESSLFNTFSEGWSSLDLEFSIKVTDPGESGVPSRSKSGWGWDQSHGINGGIDVGGLDSDSLVKSFNYFLNLFQGRSSHGGRHEFFNGIHNNFLKAFEISEHEIVVEKTDVNL